MVLNPARSNFTSCRPRRRGWLLNNQYLNLGYVYYDPSLTPIQPQSLGVAVACVARQIVYCDRSSYVGSNKSRIQVSRTYN
jgi:hypothetical protein